MVGLYETNREAFGASMNDLRAGAVLRIPDAAELAALAAASRGGDGLAVYSRSAGPIGAPRAWRRQPDDPLAAAHELFAVLRALDEPGVARIAVELPPDDPAWDGVRDRLQRAAADGAVPKT